MGFKAAAKNVLFGDKVELQSFEKEGGGKYFLTPRKLSVDAKAALRREQIELGTAAGPAVQKLIRDKKKEFLALNKKDESDEVKLADLQDMMTDEEWDSLLTSSKTAMDQRPIMRILLRHGIGRHNLDDDKGKVLPIDDDLVEAIMDIDVLAKEMVEVIREWDSPLQKGSDDSSETAASGASKETTSKQE